MPRDYYIILGVSRNAELNKIKKAYRKAVKRYHPDSNRSGESTQKFLEVKEAYNTLSNDAMRRKYDETLARLESHRIIAHAPSLVEKKTSLFNELDSFVSSVDDFFSGVLPGFFDRARSVGKDLYLEIILSPREASAGGLFPITVPVLEHCPLCSKSGLWEGFFCCRCRGYGWIKSAREFSLSVPPQVKHGTEIKLSLEDIGLKGSNLMVTVVTDLSLENGEW